MYFNFSSITPFGAGNLLIIASNISSIPSPVFPEQEIAQLSQFQQRPQFQFLFFRYLKQVNLFYLKLVLPRD